MSYWLSWMRYSKVGSSGALDRFDLDVQPLRDLLCDLAVGHVDVGSRLLLRAEAVQDVQAANRERGSAAGGERRPQRGDLALEHRAQRALVAHAQLEALAGIEQLQVAVLEGARVRRPSC